MEHLERLSWEVISVEDLINFLPNKFTTGNIGPVALGATDNENNIQGGKVGYGQGFPIGVAVGTINVVPLFQIDPGGATFGTGRFINRSEESSERYQETGIYIPYIYHNMHCRLILFCKHSDSISDLLKISYSIYIYFTWNLFLPDKMSSLWKVGIFERVFRNPNKRSMAGQNLFALRNRYLAQVKRYEDELEKLTLPVHFSRGHSCST